MAKATQIEEPKTAKPFIRWCGGKAKLVPELLALAPKVFNTYREPFLGGGALFFALAARLPHPRYAVLSDANEELMHTYGIVQGQHMNLIVCLQKAAHAHSKEHYYFVRSVDPKTLDDVGRAARMLYLNNTAFNGLYRVNRSGGFNVPWDPDRSGAVNEDVIARASEALRGHRLLTQDFRHVEKQANDGDFCYFDSPYVPVSATANFTSYTKDGFSWHDQVDLHDLALRLKRRGVHVMLSNAGTQAVRDLYVESDFEIHETEARRNINSKGTKRGAVPEFIIR